MSGESYWLILKERIPTFVEPLVSLGDITTQLQDALRSPPTTATWVGPNPRVTRLGGLTERFSVRAAWVLRIPPLNALSPIARARSLAAQIDGRFAEWDNESHLIGPATPNWTDAVVTEYSPGANGSLAWWSGGFASRTLTMNRASTASAARAENPIGPDDATTRVDGAPGSPQPDKYGRWLTTIAVGAGVVAVAYAVAQIASASASVVGTRHQVSLLAAKPRPNPHRRRRRAAKATSR